MSVEVTYSGHDNTACTRALAALSEQRLMPDGEVTIRQELGKWLLLFKFNNPPEGGMLDEIDLHCTDYGLRRAEYYNAATGELL